jgi:alpha-beta hydrolase superfamily lysophospholipase
MQMYHRKVLLNTSMKKRWIAFALPIALGLALDNALPYMVIDHANRPVALRSQLWNIAKTELLTVTSPDGTMVSGWWVPRSGATKTVILLHSLGGNREDLSTFVEPIWRAGFNLVMLDLRSHGMSTGRYFTYGFQEWQDVQAAIDAVNSKQPNQSFSILGVSAGGTVAISAAAHDLRIRTVVTIGTFADLGQTIEAYIPQVDKESFRE